MSPRSRRIRARRDGTYDLRLPNEERQLLTSLTGQLVSALAASDLTANELAAPLRRLFPPAYLDDETAEAGYTELMRTELLEERRAALDLLRRGATKRRIGAHELEGWLSAVNDLRLFLGSTLEVTEESVLPEPDDDRYAEWICYSYLSFLEGEVVEALSGSFPPITSEAEDPPEDPWGEPPGGLRWDGTPQPDEP